MSEREQTDDSEINAIPLVQRVIFRWRYLFLAMLPGPIGVLIFALFFATLPHKTMNQDIRLFGVFGGAYPNGVAFQKEDLMTPEVMTALGIRVGLPELHRGKYSGLLSIERTAVNTDMIRHIYDQKAKAVKDEKSTTGSLKDLEDLNTEMLERIADENKNLYQLTINHERYGVSISGAERILQAWPSIWQREFISNFRVMTDLTFKGSNLIDAGDLSKPENAYYANDQLNHVARGLSIMSGDIRFLKLQSNLKRTPDEMIMALEEYRKTFFQPLYSSVLSIDSPLSEFYLQDLRLNVAKIDKEIDSLQRVVHDVLAVDVRTTTEPGPKADGDIITIGDGTLNDIVGLVQKASMQDFLTSTLKERHALEVQKAVVEKNLAQVDTNKLLTPQFVEATSKIHKDIIDEYNFLLALAERRVTQDALEFYVPVSAPYLNGSATNPYAVRVAGLLALLGFFVCGLVFVFIPRSEEKNV